MSAEAIARLRAARPLHDSYDGVVVSDLDLRVLLDRIAELEAEVLRRDALIRADGYEDMRQHAVAMAALAKKAEAEHAEVLDALEGLAANLRFLDVEFYGEDEMLEAEAKLGIALAVLAKAGRR